MLYYGGSSFGWNGVADYTNPSSPLYDSEVDVLLYYTDFYGTATFNLPAAWRYRNLLLTSVHPEADNCTGGVQAPDCPRAGTIPERGILRNRAWLATWINRVANTSFAVPRVPVAPSFNQSAPHRGWPAKPCYASSEASSGAASGSRVLLCDGFDAAPGDVPHGLWQWQRNQTTFVNGPRPWNTSYDGTAADGNGWAVCRPQAPSGSATARITPRAIATPASGATFSFAYKGHGATLFVVFTDNDGESWTTLQETEFWRGGGGGEWRRASYRLPGGRAALFVRFACASDDTAKENFCGVDSVVISS